MGTIWITGKLSASAWSVWGHAFKSDEYKTLRDGKLPQEVVGIAGNRINMGSLCTSSKTVYMQLLNGSENKPPEPNDVFIAGRKRPEKRDYHQNRFFKYWSPLAKDITAFQETATGWQLLYPCFLELLYQNTASSTFKEGISKLEISKSTNNPSANKPKLWNSWHIKVNSITYGLRTKWRPLKQPVGEKIYFKAGCDSWT